MGHIDAFGGWWSTWPVCRSLLGIPILILVSSCFGCSWSGQQASTGKKIASTERTIEPKRLHVNSETEHRSWQGQFAVMSEFAKLIASETQIVEGREQFCFTKLLWLWPDDYGYRATNGNKDTTFGPAASKEQVIETFDRFGIERASQDLTPARLAGILLAPERAAAAVHGFDQIGLLDALKEFHLHPVEPSITYLARQYGPIRFYRGTASNELGVEFRWSNETVRYVSTVSSPLGGDPADTGGYVIVMSTTDPIEYVGQDFQSEFSLNFEFDSSNFSVFAAIDNSWFDCETRAEPETTR